MEYTGIFRTTLSKKEKEAIKANASRQGMTLTGYIDSLCRTAIKDEEVKNGTAATRA